MLRTRFLAGLVVFIFGGVSIIGCPTPSFSKPLTENGQTEMDGDPENWDYNSVRNQKDTSLKLTGDPDTWDLSPHSSGMRERRANDRHQLHIDGDPENYNGRPSDSAIYSALIGLLTWFSLRVL